MYKTQTKLYLNQLKKNENVNKKYKSSLCSHINNMNEKYGNKFRRMIKYNFIVNKK